VAKYLLADTPAALSAARTGWPIKPTTMPNVIKQKRTADRAENIAIQLLPVWAFRRNAKQGEEAKFQGIPDS
jgi:hypothetical protein